MSRAVASGPSTTPARGTARATSADRPLGYFEQSSLPLTSLLFLVPLILVYEVGTYWYSSDPVSHVEQHIVAFIDLQRFFNLFGATGPYMPAATVVGLLLTFHVLRKDVTEIRWDVLVRMVLESVMYAIPLLATWYLLTTGTLFQHYLLSRLIAENWRRLLVLSIGAGIYEEMVFRLIFFHLLHMILVDCLKVPKLRAVPLMVVTSGIAFSLYHYRIPGFPWPSLTGSETFEWRSFVFRTLAGIYFGVIFMWRGFGLTAGAHASYDILIVVLRMTGQG